MPQTLQAPEISDGATGRGRWMTVIFDNDHNSMDEVVEALIWATGCDEEEAGIEMWEAHTYGKAPVHFASEEECRTVATSIERAGIRTEVAPEWDD